MQPSTFHLTLSILLIQHYTTRHCVRTINSAVSKGAEIARTIYIAVRKVFHYINVTQHRVTWSKQKQVFFLLYPTNTL